MVGVDGRDKIRPAYFVEHKGIRRIAKEFRHSCGTVNKAIAFVECGRTPFGSRVRLLCLDPTRHGLTNYWPKVERVRGWLQSFRDRSADKPGAPKETDA
jgi:hypothetical protein